MFRAFVSFVKLVFSLPNNLDIIANIVKHFMLNLLRQNFVQRMLEKRAGCFVWSSTSIHYVHGEKLICDRRERTFIHLETKEKEERGRG